VRAAAATCGPISAADHRPVPYLRYWLDGNPGSVTTFEGGAAPRGPLRLYPRGIKIVRRFYKANLPKAKPPANFVEVFRTRAWTVVAAPQCAGRAGVAPVAAG
jgi:hypothetical protein